MTEMFSLKGQVAVVTGASRGLGYEMARAVAQCGARVYMTARGAEQLEHAAASLRDQGLDARAKAFDLANPDACVRAIAEIGQAEGRLDILVNNAGISHRHPPEEYPLSEWYQLLEVHLNASFDLSQQAAKHMLPRGRGKIINIGSVMTFEGGLNIPAYAAAKHGLAGLTKSLGNSWGKRGINVNCICPGYFETTLSHVLQDDPVRGPQILDRIPVGRWGQPDELAGLCVFLASDASNYMHGSTVAIDGGWLSR